MRGGAISDAILTAAVTKLGPGILKGLMRRGVSAVLGDEPERALVEVCHRAVRRAVAEAALVEEDNDWLDEVAAGLAATLNDPSRVDRLIRASLGVLSAEAEQAWRDEFRRAVAEHWDTGLLSQTVDVERLLDVFSSALWDELSAEAVKPGSPLAPLWTHSVFATILSRLSDDQLPSLSSAEIRERLIDYLRQVDARARDRPLLAPERFDLDALHQQVRTRTAGPAKFRNQPTDHVYLPKGAHEADDPSGISWWTAIRDRHRHLVVLGEPGYGKTWLLRYEAHLLAVAALAYLCRGGDPEQVQVPVWLRLDELVAALPAAASWEQLPVGLVRALRSHHRLSPGLGRWLDQRVAAGRCVLLLDAWDEATDKEQRDVLSGVLTGWIRNNLDGRVVITSRLAGYTGSPLDVQDVAHVELVPFSPDEVERFIKAWFASDPAAGARLRGQLEDNPSAAGMSRVPLLLTLLCALASAPDEELPRRRVELYERMLRRFLAREHRPLGRRPDDLEIASTLEVLGHVAFAFADRNGAWVDRMPADDLLGAIRGTGDSYQELVAAGRGAAGILATLSGEDGVLIPAGDPTGGRSVPYLFLHRTFHEFLAARHLSQQPAERWVQVVEAHRWFEPEWDEAIAMLAGLLPNPDPLLQLLADALTIPSTPGCAKPAARSRNSLLTAPVPSSPPALSINCCASCTGHVPTARRESEHSTGW